MLIGCEALGRLRSARVAVFGVGGVGGFTVEALARAGVGRLVLVDKDIVEPSNINRQLVASTGTLSRPKVAVAGDRLRDINPQIELLLMEKFFLPENAEEFDFDSYDYVVDAVDTISAKLQLVKICSEKGIPLISCMGMGNRLNPGKIRVCDIFETKNCSLSKIIRKELRKLGIEKLKVVSSTEEEIEPKFKEQNFDGNSTKRSPASMVIVPAVAGLYLASEVINHFIAKNNFS